MRNTTRRAARRLRVTAMVGAVAVTVALVAVGSATPAQADTGWSTPLPWPSFGRILTDAHGHVFITGGRDSSSLWVRAADGSAVTTVPAQQGASGMALSADGATLFVALTDANAISAISTTALTETARYPLPGRCPDSLAVVGGDVWFSTACYGSSSQLGRLVVATGHATYYPTTSADPLLLAVPGAPPSLLVASKGESPSTVRRYEVTGGTLTLAASGGPPNGANLQSMALDPDGVHVIVACGWPYRHHRLRLDDLLAEGTYPSGTYPHAVATSTALGGIVAAGVNGIYWPDISVYRAGELVDTIDFPTSDSLLRDGLAWAPDGSRLYAVTETHHLHVIDAPTKGGTTLTMSGPANAVPGSTVTLTGALSTLEGPLPAIELTVTRVDASGSHPLAPVTTDDNGSYSLSDTLGSSSATWTISYPGDADHPPTHASATVAAVKQVAVVTIAASASTVARTRSVSLSGALSLAGAPAPSRALRLTRTDGAGTALVDRPITGADGTWSVTDAPSWSGPATYRIAWDGDATTDAGAATSTVTVVGAVPALSVRPSGRTFAYGARASVAIRLGPTSTNRRVTVSVAAYPRDFVTAGTYQLGAASSLVLTRSVTSRTTVRVSFAGDRLYSSRTVSVTLHARAKVVTALKGAYAVDAGTRLFHRRSDPVLAVTVTPRPAGCITLTGQVRVAGSWRPTTSICLTPDARGRVAASLIGKHAVGATWRVRASTPATGGTVATASPWLSLRFTQ